MSLTNFTIPYPVIRASEWLSRAWHIAIPPIAGIALSYIVLLLTPPIYTATVSFFPPSQGGNPVSGVVNQLNALGVLPGSAQGKTQAEQYVAMLKSRSIADAVSTKFDLSRIYGKLLPEEVRLALAKRTTVYMSSRSELIEVSVDDAEPKRAAKMATYYIEALTGLLARVAINDARQRRIFLEKQVDETRVALEKTEQQLRSAGISPSAAQLEPSAAVGMVAQINAAIATQEIRLSALRSIAGSANSSTLAAMSELAALKRRLAEMQAGEKSTPGDTYAALYRDYKYNSALLELLATQLASARIDEARDSRSLQIVDYAVIPQKKSKPTGALYLGVGLALGLALSALAWFVARTLSSNLNDRQR